MKFEMPQYHHPDFDQDFLKEAPNVKLEEVKEAAKTLEQELVVLRETEKAETELQNHLDSLNTSLETCI